MTIPTFKNGDSLEEVRENSINPAINKINELVKEIETLKLSNQQLHTEAIIIKNKINSLEGDAKKELMFQLSRR